MLNGRCSNHGGKSFDALPSPLVTLPAVCGAVAGRVPVMFDSGIRRGWEILVAIALGARFTFVGRATLYGVAAGGRLAVAQRLEHPLHALRVVLVHLAAERGDVVALHRPPKDMGSAADAAR